MTPRSIRRAQERKARKEMERKARNAVLRAEELDSPEPAELQETEPPTLSHAKLAANRANAQLSTGPKSQEGRTKVSLNAVKTALTGRTVLLPGDDAADYERHIQAFADEYAPIGPRESDLVQSIADTWWRLKRIPCLESALLAQGYVEAAESLEVGDPSTGPSLFAAQAFLKYEKQLRNLQLQEARLYRRYEKDRAELLTLQQARKQKEAEALAQAATLLQAAREANQPFHPADFGFEFSIAQLEQHLALTRARNAAQNRPPSRQAQAA